MTARNTGLHTRGGSTPVRESSEATRRLESQLLAIRGAKLHVGRGIVRDFPERHASPLTYTRQVREYTAVLPPCSAFDPVPTTDGERMLIRCQF